MKYPKLKAPKAALLGTKITGSWSSEGPGRGKRCEITHPGSGSMDRKKEAAFFRSGIRASEKRGGGSMRKCPRKGARVCFVGEKSVYYYRRMDSPDLWECGSVRSGPVEAKYKSCAESVGGKVVFVSWDNSVPDNPVFLDDIIRQPGASKRKARR